MSGQIFDNALIEFGIPQGSVLIPLLFLIYINDLNQAIKFRTVHHFADNTNLLLVDNSLKKMNKHINHDSKLLTTWLRANRTSLNTSKTGMLLLRPKSKRNITKHLNFRINGHQYIPRTTQIKYLGLTMNEHLDWDIYFSQLKKKLNCGIGLLAKIRHFTPKHLNAPKKQMYETNILKLKDFIMLQNILFVKDCQSENAPGSFNNKFHSSI